MSMNTSNVRKKPTALAAVVLIVVVAAGGYFGYRAFFGGTSKDSAKAGGDGAQPVQQLSSTDTSH